MGYGFVIDHRKCIGCHACTVACKSENEVPVGQFRTWVKYTEKGSFPDVKRHFTVLRCNHCDAAPCVEICPVVALHKRPDAIVDLDRDLCIGCRACMQACPYDALYLNEDNGTAEKCHYCAHRTEIGLEPACVVVCPEQAIVAGDADDPASKIGRLIEEEETSRRKVEMGTEPRVWYIDALPESLVPGTAAEPESWLWSDRQMPPAATPEGFEPPPDLITTFDAEHPPVWGIHVWSYLLTKNIAAGVMMIAPFLAMMGISAGVLPEILGLFFLGVTSFLLVHDLGRPERFLKIITHPNPRSWLVKGTWVLMGFGGLTSFSLLLLLIDSDDAAATVRWINLPFAAMAAGYSAFLFAQCKGRELWQERGLFVQLLLRAALMGSAMALVMVGDRFTNVLFIGLAILTSFGMMWERMRPRDHAGAERAEAILRESFRSQSAVTMLLIAAAISQVGAWVADPETALWITTDVVAAVISVIALYAYERAWIRAGQAVPIS